MKNVNIKSGISKRVKSGSRKSMTKKVPIKRFVKRDTNVGKFSVVKKKNIPIGMSETRSGLLVPNNVIQPVPANKLRNGFEKAKTEIKDMIEEIASILTSEYKIKEIELEVSFSADGKFLGFGVGGSTSIKIKITPAGT